MRVVVVLMHVRKGEEHEKGGEDVVSEYKEAGTLVLSVKGREIIKIVLRGTAARATANCCGCGAVHEDTYIPCKRLSYHDR